MKTYNVCWKGLDRGHEGEWEPGLWRLVLNAFAEFSPVDLKDADSNFYKYLESERPEVQWVTASPSGEVRTFFRDGREPWASTRVVLFPKASDTASITSVGKYVINGLISYADVLAAAALGLVENQERPFAILTEALRLVPKGRGISIDDAVRVMRHYRSGDDISEVLAGPVDNIPANCLRRLKGILLLMRYSGLAVQIGDVFYAGQTNCSCNGIRSDLLREQFLQWLANNNVVGSGKSESYEIALEDATVIAKSFCSEFRVPTVYEMPEESLISLQSFINIEKKKEEACPGSSRLSSLANLHGISYWRDGYCASAITALLWFKQLICRIKLGDSITAASNDVLTVALKAFSAKRASDWLLQGRAANERLREYFEPLTEQVLSSFNESQINELFLGVKDPVDQHVDLVTMWAGRNGNGWSNINPGNDPQKVLKIREYLVRLKHDTAIESTYWSGNDPLRPAGFGPSVISELLMKFHPDDVLMYAKEGCVALKLLGLIDFDTPNSTNIAKQHAEYKLVQAAGTIILAKLRAMHLDRMIRADGTGDGAPADYLTVNEFLCFVHDNFQEIKNMARQMQQKTVTQNRTAGNNDWSKLPNDDPDSLMYRLAASLLTRPFAILAGASGTGKSRMVKKLACMTCYDDDLKPTSDNALGNYKMIQVKPSWHDSAELLGYRSMLNPDVVDYKSTDFVRFVLKAHAYPNTPFFVCLDEMNLAPVEQYFAEFLSACESVEKKEEKDAQGNVTDTFYVTAPLIPPTEYDDDIDNIGLEYPLDAKVKARINKFGLYIPRNLFVVGTVNMDDTTCQFSRKVLDRAMTIEMNVVEFDGLKNPEELIVQDVTDATTGQVVKPGLLMKADQIKAFIDRKDFNKDTLDGPFLDLLKKIQEIVKLTPFAVGYRFALETAMYREALKLINADKMQVDDPANPGQKIDASGIYALDHMILTKILPRVTGNKEERKKLVDDLYDYFATKLTSHTQSKQALDRMLDGAGSNGGYLSFWP